MPAEFDRYSQTYQEHVKDTIAFSGVTLDFVTDAKAKHLQRLVYERFADPMERTVLDIGCGTGNIHRYLAASLGPLTGVDVSEKCLDTARASNSSVAYRAFDGDRLPFADSAFDVVYTICVMHHVPPAGWAAYVAEMHRVTAPGGIAVVIEHNPLNPLTRLAVNRCEFDKGAVLLTPWKVRSLMRLAKFEQIRTRHFLFMPFGGGFFGSIDRGLGFIPFGAQYYVAAAKPLAEGDAYCGG